MRFADITGQEDLKRHLTQSVDAGRVSHAQLFTGTAGSGALAVAVAYVQYLCCRHRSGGDSCGECPDCRQIAALAHPDLHLVFPVNKQGKKSGEVMRSDEFLPQFRALFAERGGYFSPQDWYDRLDLGKTLKGMIAAREADEIIRKLSFKSFEADYKTMLIWLPEAMNEEAANKILKILEEPPEHLMFILATTELHKVPATILSRCQRFSFRRIQPKDIVGRLNYIAGQENIDLKEDGAALLARLSDGALRDALSLLDQCAAAGGAIDANAVLDALGLAGNVQTAQLMSLILTRDARRALELLGKLYDGGKDVGAVLGELSTLSRELLISATAGEGGESLLSGAYDAATLRNLRAQGTSARFIQLCTILQETAAQLQFSVNRRTDAELCILKLCDETLSGDLAALGARIARLEEQIAAGVQFAAKHPASAPASAPTPAAVQTVTPTPEKAAEAPTESAKPAEEAPLPWDEPPLPDDYDAPPPYGEPVAPAPKAAAPKIAAAPAPAQEAPASGESGDDEIFYQLMESYKNRLTPDKRAFIGMAQGDVKDDLLTVYCSTEVQKSMLDQKVVTDVLSEVTSRAVGREIRVRFLVGERPGAKKRDKMQDLMRMGSKFDNFTVK